MPATETEGKANQAQATPNLTELRKQGHEKSFSFQIRKRFPWLFDIHSLFYYGLGIFLIGMLWSAYSLATNSFTQLYNWDYNSQYVTITYDFWDTWHTFFKTGVFQLYSTNTFLGTDNIGSNSYYGLFDPFLALCYLFPRNLIPQTFAIATFFKAVASAIFMRLYLKYMGVSESSSRFGGLAFAFCGYVNFFVGFPTFVSVVSTVPLILLGIEKVIKEKKIACLVLGLFLLGIISFFFLVVVCIWGVMYAMWRYFCTIKQRDWKNNLLVIGIGVFSFALGLMLCSWTLLPSIRESSLSGRTTSIGAAYWLCLKTAAKSFDLKTVFSLLFEPVGNNPGRELMGLVGFFFPTCNYLYLPLMMGTDGYPYDSWISSIFCYTPMIILFVSAVISDARRKNWVPLIAIVLCSYLLFTDFAYYFFYAFAGDGYGRWFIVLVPEIIYYGAQELDRIKTEPKWLLPLGTVSTFVLTSLSFLVTYFVLKNWSGTTSLDPYWNSGYVVPAYTTDTDGIIHSTLWLILYQISLVGIEGVVMNWQRTKPFLTKILAAFTVVEIAVAGNISFAYGSLWNYQTTYLGGVAEAAKSNEVFSQLADYDSSSYYRVHSDSYPNTNAELAFHFNGSANFHSLFNYDVAELARYSHMINDEGSYVRYGQTVSKKSWAAYYANKRYGLDTAFGTKYYVIKNEGYPSCDGVVGEPAANVPFGSKLVFSTDTYRVYENPYVNDVALGHAVDSIYAENQVSDQSTDSAFYGGTNPTLEILRNEDVFLNGAIVEDQDVSRISKDFDLSTAPSATLSSTSYTNVSYRAKKISTVNHKNVLGSNGETTDTYDCSYYYIHNDLAANKTYYEGPSYFLTQLSNPKVVAAVSDYTFGGLSTLQGDYDKLVLYPTSGFGNYFTSDPTGCYFAMSVPTVGTKAYRTPRVYFVGDTYEADGVTVKESNVLLSYEWSALQNWRNLRTDSSGNLFGFYCPGRVKYVVFCDKTWGGSAIMASSSPSLFMMPRSTVEQQNAKLASADYNLTNVTYSPDHFTFETHFSKQKLVVTSLGYDAGWSASATVRGTDGNTITTPLEMYKLDGGFVGFAAPEGDVSYTLTYVTPELKTGSILAVAGLGLFLSYQIGYFCYARRHKKRSAAPLSVK